MAKLDLIGSSTRFRAVFNQISMVAPGTGKEVIAPTIHQASPHLQKRFVAVKRGSRRAAGE